MKKSLLALSLLALSNNHAMANEQDKVNYGDPTASYRGIGVQATNDAAQLVGVFGFGEHIASFDLGTNFDTNSLDYRIKYFNVDQDSGFGWSIDAIGSHSDDLSSNGILAGLVQKYQVSDNVIVVPMFAAGYIDAEDKLNNTEESSWIAQPGVFALYAFEAGHWLYANPKTTYINETSDWTAELELGGGYMAADNISVGFKYEVTHLNGDTTDKTWVNAYYYF